MLVGCLWVKRRGLVPLIVVVELLGRWLVELLGLRGSHERLWIVHQFLVHVRMSLQEFLKLRMVPLKVLVLRERRVTREPFLHVLVVAQEFVEARGAIAVDASVVSSAKSITIRPVIPVSEY